MDLEVEIRKAELREASLLSKIALDAKSFWNYPEEFMKLWKDDLTITSDFIAANLVRCALVESTVVGFYALIKDDSHFELDHLWILPNYIGEGVDSKLFNDVVTFISNQGGRVLKILSDPNAEKFYLKKGAQRIKLVSSKPVGRKLPLLELNITKTAV